MRLNELISWNGVSSTAVNSLGKNQPDEIMPQGIQSTDDEGNTYTWQGRLWTDNKTKRIAKRDKGQELTHKELGKDHKGDVYIRFANGYEYIYQDVPKSVYDQWMSSSSKGKFLNTNIKPVYGFKRLK